MLLYSALTMLDGAGREYFIAVSDSLSEAPASMTMFAPKPPRKPGPGSTKKSIFAPYQCGDGRDRTHLSAWGLAAHAPDL